MAEEALVEVLDVLGSERNVHIVALGAFVCVAYATGLLLTALLGRV